MSYPSMSSRPGRTAGQHSFAAIPSVDIQRSVFNRSCGLTSSFDSGELVPIFVDEALPGDTFTCGVSTFARLATPIVPIMDNLYLDLFFFFVPARLVWSNFQKFMGEQTDPGDSTDYVIPQVTAPAGGWASNSLGDYLGIPPFVEVDVNALPFRAYNLIYNEWFRDQNLVDSVPVSKTDGPDTYTDYAVRKRGKRHDYFTSCLPFAQKGDPIELPLGTSAPVTGSIAGSGAPTWNLPSSLSNVPLIGVAGSSGTANTGWNGTVGFTTGAATWNTPNLVLSGAVADLSSATAATINAIREAFQVQRLLERDARGGTRYTEVIRSHFGVVSPDQRLQRPEYLGGGTAPIMVHPVPQTAIGYASDPTPKGDLGAFATASFRGRGFHQSFTEHGYVIGLACVRADLNYQEGVERMWNRQTRYDFYWPSLAHLGEQEVLNKEIYADGSANDDLAFGYQERYAEYRYKPSKITGRMRSQAGLLAPGDATLHYWHLAQEFGSLPLLNEAFITENPPVARVLAVTNEPQILFDAFFDLRCVRPMPTFSVPGFVDHF